MLVLMELAVILRVGNRQTAASNDTISFSEMKSNVVLEDNVVPWQLMQKEWSGEGLYEGEVGETHPLAHHRCKGLWVDGTVLRLERRSDGGSNSVAAVRRRDEENEGEGLE